MLLKWQANGQLKLDCTELYAQYSQNVAHLYVLTDVLNKNDGQMFCQFGKWDAATMQYLTLKDENGNPKIYTMGWKVLEKPDSETPSWLYDCYIPAELLTYKDAVCVTLKFQQNGQTGNPDNPTAIFATGNLGFNIEQNLPTGQIIPSDSELAALIAKVNALELNSMTSANTTAYAETLAPTSEATVSVTSTTDSSGQKHFVFNFGIPQGVKGDSGINSALLSNEDGDSDENGFTQQFINKRIAAVIEKIDSLLSSEDGDSETLGYTQSAVNRIANAKVVNSAGTSEAQAYSQAAANATFSNPNLLINPDFKINQRGQTSYSENNKYTVDRWAITGSTGLTVTPQQGGGLQLSSTGTGYVLQHIEDTISLLGKTITMSCELGDGTILKASGTLPSSAPTSFTTFFVTESINGLRLGLNYYSNLQVIGIVLALEPNTSATVKWIKLEMGSVATTFVTPVIAEELVKCQRYYYRLRSNGANIYLGTGSFATPGNNKVCIVPFKFPVTMRQAPTVTYLIQRTSGGDAVARLNYALLNYDHSETSNSICLLWFIARSYEATTGQACDVFITEIISDNISFDAEIY